MAADPICTTMVIAFWQRYLAKLAEWLGPLPCWSLPSDLVYVCQKRGWIEMHGFEHGLDDMSCVPTCRISLVACRLVAMLLVCSSGLCGSLESTISNIVWVVGGYDPTTELDFHFQPANLTVFPARLLFRIAQVLVRQLGWFNGTTQPLLLYSPAITMLLVVNGG